jgi:hypothetical protein
MGLHFLCLSHLFLNDYKAQMQKHIFHKLHINDLWILNQHISSNHLKFNEAKKNTHQLNEFTKKLKVAWKAIV